MNTLKLNKGSSFAIENVEKKLRLIVYNQDVENVCRKTSEKIIKDFLQSGEDHLFKGRLQLYKTGDIITVEVKGKPAGEISITDFINCLNNSKKQSLTV